MLIGIRQIWGLFCNLYLLTYQPYLTLQQLKQRGDKSQVVLIGLTGLSPFIAYSLARLILDIRWYGEWRLNVGVVFGITVLVELFILGYLGYWAGKVLKNNRQDRFTKGYYE